MYNNQVLHVEISESKSEFRTLDGSIISSKISVEELSEFLRLLSVSYATAQRIERAGGENANVNIDTCLLEIFLISSELANKNKDKDKDNNSLQFSNGINLYHQTLYFDSFSEQQLDIVSINYNSPLKISISGSSLRNLVIAVALLGGEVSTGDFSVKMPGIADVIARLSTTYIEIQKFNNNSKPIELEVDKYLKSLPHQDVNTINSLKSSNI